MKKHNSSTKKYYSILIGAALLTASLFHFSKPVFSAGTAAGQKIRNTATGSYEDNDGQEYRIDSNTVEVTVAKVAGITNVATGFTDETTGSNNTPDGTINNSVLTGDKVSFEFTVTNVGNDTSNIFIPNLTNIATRGLQRSGSNFKLSIKGINTAANQEFSSTATNFIEIANAQTASTTIEVKDVPANGQIVVKVEGIVTATAAGAPIEVLLGDTGSNTVPDSNNQVAADTQNRPDNIDYVGGSPVPAEQNKDVRTLNPTTPTNGVTYSPSDLQKEASSRKRVFLGANPLAAVRIEKVRGEVDPGAEADNLKDNIIPYSLNLEVLTTTPGALYTPGKLEGRSFPDARMPNTVGTDKTNLVLVSDAVPQGTILNQAISGFTDAQGRVWTPVYSLKPEPDNKEAANNLVWTTVPSDLANVARIGWVYNVNGNTGQTQNGPIDAGTTITTNTPPSASDSEISIPVPTSGFYFEVITNGLENEGGTVANIAQVFGTTFDGTADNDPNGPEVFDESGDQDPSNFNGTVPGPKETSPGSTGIANPANHGVDSENNNTAEDSPGGEDNVITIGAPGTLINGPQGQPAATGNALLAANAAPNNNHDFQNKGIDNFSSATSTNASVSGNPQNNRDYTLNPNAVTFTNTVRNPAIPVENSNAGDLNNVLLQPINPSFSGFGAGDGGENDLRLPNGTKVTIELGGKQAVYTYTRSTATDGKFTLDAPVDAPGTDDDIPSAAIVIPTLKAGVSLDYTVTIDLPNGTELSTDVNHGFAVPIIAFVDGDNNSTPSAADNGNYTTNQVYTGFVKITKDVDVIQPNGDTRSGDPLPGDTLRYTVNYRNISEPQVGTGNNLVLEGRNVRIDENGTLDAVTAVTDGNNWALDNNNDGDLDTINVQGTATDSSDNSKIEYYTGATALNATDLYSVDTLIPAGTVDPGDTVTGYRATIPIVPPTLPGNPFQFTFERKVDRYDGQAENIENLPNLADPVSTP